MRRKCGTSSIPSGCASCTASSSQAGADIVLTNTFGGNRHRLKLHNEQDRVREINMAAAAHARAEADAAGRPVYVGGSIGPTGEIFKPVGTLPHEEGVSAFAEQAMALKEGGVDVLWIETMSSEEELRAAVEGAAKAGLPIVTTMSFDTNGRTMMGITPKAFGALAASLGTQPVAIGANCGVGASELVATVLGISDARPDAAIVAKGNCGIPQYMDGHIHYTGTPELMADYARIALDAGAKIIGGCCGTSPGTSGGHAEIPRELHQGRAPLDRTGRAAPRPRLSPRQGHRHRRRGRGQA